MRLPPGTFRGGQGVGGFVIWTTAFKLSFPGMGRSRRTSGMTIVGLDNFLHEPMPHNIPFIEVNELDTLVVLVNVTHFDESGDTVGRQINLCNVSGHHGFGVEAQSREKHLHLFGRRILSFV